MVLLPDGDGEFTRAVAYQPAGDVDISGGESRSRNLGLRASHEMEATDKSIEVGDVESNAIGLRFGDATGIYDLKNLNVLDANYYDLSGRRLEGRPTETGIYIVNGKKVVVK